MHEAARRGATISQFFGAVGIAGRLLAWRGYEASVGDDAEGRCNRLNRFGELGLRGAVSVDEHNSIRAQAEGSVPSLMPPSHVQTLLLAEERARVPPPPLPARAASR